MAVLLIPIAYALQDCNSLSIINVRDLPCLIITTYDTDAVCNSYSIKYWDSSADLKDTQVMDTFGGTGRCNNTFPSSGFNATKGSYIWNITNGDTGRITVEVDDEMAYIGMALCLLILVIVYIVFIALFRKRYAYMGYYFYILLIILTWFAGYFGLEIAKEVVSSTAILKIMDTLYWFVVLGSLFPLFMFSLHIIVKSVQAIKQKRVKEIMGEDEDDF